MGEPDEERPDLGPLTGWHLPLRPVRRVNLCSVEAMVLGVVSAVFYPIIFGGPAVLLGVAAVARRERWARWGLAVAVLGTAVGFVIGALYGPHALSPGHRGAR